MLGLALEGGGARGAFQMGAVKALFEAGYQFDGIVGTSIGALNAAIIAQGDFTAGFQLWEAMSNSLLLGIEEAQLEKFRQRKIDKAAFKQLTAKGIEFIEKKGLDTSRMRQVIDSIVDEDKLRASSLDFGLVTVNITDLKPLELYKEDIPPGKIPDYIMASASFPGFRLEPIDGKYFLDGGLYDNIPINLLAKKGYKEIIAIRTMSPGIIQDIKYPGVNITTIRPSEDLGRMLNFDNQLIRRNLAMGYFDAQRVIKNLLGRKYYLQPFDETHLIQILAQMPDTLLFPLAKLLEVKAMNPPRMLFEKMLPKIAGLLALPLTASYQEIITSLLEQLAEEGGLGKYKIYSIPEFLAEIKKIPALKYASIFPPRFSRKLVLLEAAQVFSELLSSAWNN